MSRSFSLPACWFFLPPLPSSTSFSGPRVCAQLRDLTKYDVKVAAFNGTIAELEVGLYSSRKSAVLKLSVQVTGNKLNRSRSQSRISGWIKGKRDVGEHNRIADVTESLVWKCQQLHCVTFILDYED
jgi:hypothetical protein